MKIVLDEDRFDRLQLKLAELLMRHIRDDLEQGGLDPDRVRDLATTLTFTVTGILDGGEVLEDEEDAPSPLLGFTLDDEGEELLVAEGGSWMQDSVPALAEDLFGSEGRGGDEEEDDDDED